MIDTKFEIVDCKKTRVIDVELNVLDIKDLEVILKMFYTYTMCYPIDYVYARIFIKVIPISDQSIFLIKKYLSRILSHSKKIAVIPSETIQRMFIMELNKTSNKKFGLFKDKEEACEWLTHKDNIEEDEFETII